MRLLLEMRRYEYSYFVTLTYSNLTLPRNENGVPTLSKSDLQKFFKRLRKRISFKYFAVGEYGEDKGRPHYHAIIMTGDDVKLSFKVNKYGKTIVSNSLFHESWKKKENGVKGLIGYLDVRVIPSTSDSVRVAQYVAGYTLKKLGNGHLRPGVEQERCFMSKGLAFDEAPRLVYSSVKAGANNKLADPKGGGPPVDYQMLRVNGKLWPVSRTFRQKLIELHGGDRRSEKVKKIVNTRRIKKEVVREADPVYKQALEQHIRETQARAEKKLKRWKNAKRRIKGVLCD